MMNGTLLDTNTFTDRLPPSAVRTRPNVGRNIVRKPPIFNGSGKDSTPEQRAHLVLAKSISQAALRHFSGRQSELGLLSWNDGSGDGSSDFGTGGGSSWGNFKLPTIDTSGWNTGGGGIDDLPYTDDPFANFGGSRGGGSTFTSYNPGGNVPIVTPRDTGGGTDWAAIVHDITTQVVAPLMNKSNAGGRVTYADGSYSIGSTRYSADGSVVAAGAAAGAVVGDAVSTTAGFVGRNVIPLGIGGVLLLLFMSGRKR